MLRSIGKQSGESVESVLKKKRKAAWHYPHLLLRRRSCSNRSMDICCPPGPQQQTRRTLLQRSTDGTDRRTLYDFIDPVGSDNKRAYDEFT